jgi:hypothetical protein
LKAAAKIAEDAEEAEARILEEEVDAADLAEKAEEAAEAALKEEIFEKNRLAKT